MDTGLSRGAVGVTTNPYLANLAMLKDRAQWAAEIEAVLARGPQPALKAEALMRIAVTKAAQKLLPQHRSSQGRLGYVCGQVNPLLAGDRECMAAMARRYAGWAPNIAVKLPATSAGLDVMEDLIAEGITAAMTVSFTVPQAVAAAERHQAGIRRARASGVEPGKCFSVIMVGRLDDYLREVAQDNRAEIGEFDIRQAGIAVTKRACAIYRECGYEAVLLVAALRGVYHLTELAGADLVMSIAPAFQKTFVTEDLPREERIGLPVPEDVIERLCRIPEFVRAYEPDGMEPAEFVRFGPTQRTLSQFVEVGWRLLEQYR